MLVTLVEMKAYLGIGDNSQDTFLTEQINIISSAVENYCGRKFNSANYTQTFYAEDFERAQKFIETFQYPLISVTSVTEGGQLIDPTEYRVQLPWGRITKNSNLFFFNNSDLVVAYTAGFVNIPYELKSVAYSVVEEKYNRKTSGVPLNFGSDVQRVAIPGTISVDFDYSLNGNDRKNKYGTIIGNYLNIVDPFRSERVIVGPGRISYVT